MAGTLRQLHGAVTAHESPLLIEALLTRLTLRLLRPHFGSSFTGTQNFARAQAVRLAREHLDAHVADKVMLQDLASAARTSPYRLVRMFSAEVGMPPHAYQTQLRVRLARQLLAVGIPAAEVAAQSGFYDQAHLSKVFKSYTGVSPTQFSQGVRAA
jgi:AraC-like DNA-binding protein